MSEELTPSATWDSWTKEQRIEWLAVNIMEWEKRIGKSSGWPKEGYSWFDDDMEIFCADRDAVEKTFDEVFDPSEDWNHFRMLEEKVMKDMRLSDSFALRFVNSDVVDQILPWYMTADLQTRAKNLYLAYQELNPPSPSLHD